MNGDSRNALPHRKMTVRKSNEDVTEEMRINDMNAIRKANEINDYNN